MTLATQTPLPLSSASHGLEARVTSSASCDTGFQPEQTTRCTRQSRIPLPILGMALFLMAETMLFAGLIGTALVLRANTHQGWNPGALPKLPLWLTASNMAILLSSGWLLYCHRLPTSILLGTIFFAIQGLEWSRLLFTGVHSTATVYAGVFYALIGLHALHVLAGLFCLLYAARAPQNIIRLRACTMYWLFVVLVWPILYSLVYL